MPAELCSTEKRVQNCCLWRLFFKDHFCWEITPHFFKFESNVWYIVVYNMNNDFWKPARSPLCVSTSTGRYHYDSVWVSRDAEHWNVTHSVLVRSVQSMFLCRLTHILRLQLVFFSLLFNDIFGVKKNGYIFLFHQIFQLKLAVKN